MVRTVRVDLDLGGNAKEGLAEAGAGAERADEKVKGLNRDLKDTERDAAKAALALKLLGSEVDGASLKLDSFGRKSSSMGVIDERIEKTRSELRGLADEFDKTGNISLLGAIFGRQRQLKDLEGLKKDLTSALGEAGDEGGRAGGKFFLSSFLENLRGAGQKAVVAGIAALIVAAFFLASGPLLAATGLVGIAAGIVGQLKDPAIRNAFATMGHDLESALAAATGSFRGPLIEAASVFGGALRKVIGSIDFTNLSKAVVPLASGLGGMLSSMMPGFNKALEASIPIIETLAGELPKLGSALSDMFADFARSKDGAVVAIHLVVDTVRLLAEIIGKTVLAGAKLVDWFASVGSAIGGWLSKNGFGALKEGGARIKEFFDNLSHIPDAADPATAAVAAFGSHVSLTDDQLSALNTTLSTTKVTADTTAAAMTAKLFNAMMSVDQAILGVHTSLTSLEETLNKNGKAIDRHTGKLDLNSKAGQENDAAILGAVTANMQLYQAQIAAGMKAEDAAKNYDTNTEALRKQLRQAHYTEGQINSLIGSYAAVPDTVNTSIAVQGLTAAVNNLGLLIAKVNGLDGRNYGFSITETHYLVTADMRSSTRGNRWGGIYEHADMGLLNAGIYSPAGPARYAFAEPATGGEAFVPRFGDYSRSVAILDQAARWYGGRFVPGGSGGTQMYAPTYHVHVHALDARAAGPIIIKTIKSYERSNGTNWRGAP